MTEPIIVRADEVSRHVCRLYRHVNTHLREDVRLALEGALDKECSPVAREVLGVLIENARVSLTQGLPLCQDTGLAVAFVQLGAHVLIEGASLQDAINAGIRRAVAQHPLRASTVRDPFARENLNDNTPAIVHLEHVEGDELHMSLIAKGGGAENMSRVCMLTPADGRQGLIDAVTETVRRAGANACPPLIIGVGVGGNFEHCALLAKRALLRDLREPNADPDMAALEAELLARTNDLGIGPQGFGGRTTALAVLIETAPCHIASLPVAVNIECHSHRHGSVTLGGSSHVQAKG